jgi:sugar lactone lactonase YvrE
LLSSWALPVSQVSACAFGGPQLDELYVTSARCGLSAEQLEAEPHAGGVFLLRPGVAGVAANTFGGWS